jgi:hypothetical protein
LNEVPNPRQVKIQSVMSRLVQANDIASARTIADEAFAEPDSALKMSLLSMAATANPYAIPHLPPAMQASAIFSVDAWAKSIAMARMVAANATTRRVLISSAPKTGSTFLTRAIQRAFGLHRVSLALLSAQSYGHQTFAGALRNHEVDEMALVTACLHSNGFVAHHHMICSPYLGRQTKLYNIAPIITRRNLFDSLVSYDDHLQKQRGALPGDPYLQFAVPAEWYGMDFDDRMEFVLDYQLPWYTRYYASWHHSAAAGHIDPLTVSYEKDILGDKQVLAERIVERMGGPADSVPLLLAELDRNAGGQDNFNKGVSGRGGKITGKNRQKVEDFVHRFKIVCDLTDLLES